MALTNTTKPSTSITNTSRVASFMTWANIETTWSTETNTWLSVSALLDNTAKVSPGITNTPKP